MEKALTFEIARQKNLYTARPESEPRNPTLPRSAGKCTISRSKEQEHDTGYSQTDLRPLYVQSSVRGIILPELPDARRERLIAQYGCSLNHARTLTGELKLANFFEAVVATDPKGLSPLASTWIADTLIGELNYRTMSLDLVDPASLTDLVQLLRQGTITDKSGVEVLRVMLDQRLKNEPRESPPAIVTRLNLAMTKGDTSAITAAIGEAIAQNPKALENYRNGKAGAFNFLVGQVMKKTRGKSDPTELNRMLLEALKEGEA